MTSKARLYKKQELSWEQRITPYVPYLLIVLLIILTLLLFALVFSVMGVSANSLTGSEANHWQNMEALI